MVQSRCYILVGDEQNWKIAQTKKMWGFSERSKGSWNTTKTGELLAFYVTKPTKKKIIGFGIVKKKFIDEEIIWSDEKFVKRPIWKYRIKFDILYIVKTWENGIVLPNNIFLQVSRRVVDRNFFLKLVKQADLKWKTKIYSKIQNNIL